LFSSVAEKVQQKQTLRCINANKCKTKQKAHKSFTERLLVSRIVFYAAQQAQITSRAEESGQRRELSASAKKRLMKR
jgi:hypothetical protein